jgi:hypothetical protein
MSLFPSSAKPSSAKKWFWMLGALCLTSTGAIGQGYDPVEQQALQIYQQQLVPQGTVPLPQPVQQPRPDQQPPSAGYNVPTQSVPVPSSGTTQGAARLNSNLNQVGGLNQNPVPSGPPNSTNYAAPRPVTITAPVTGFVGAGPSPVTVTAPMPSPVPSPVPSTQTYYLPPVNFRPAPVPSPNYLPRVNRFGR